MRGILASAALIGFSYLGLVAVYSVLEWWRMRNPKKKRRPLV